MSQTAANLVDLALPDQPIRPWVIRLPFALRLPIARDSALVTGVLRIVVSELDTLMKRPGQQRGVLCGATGIVSATQLIGGSLNMNPHFHMLVVDGVFSTNADEVAVFTPTRPPAPSEVRQHAQRVHQRAVRMMRRRGMLRDESDDDLNTCSHQLHPVGGLVETHLRYRLFGLSQVRRQVPPPGTSACPASHELIAGAADPHPYTEPAFTAIDDAHVAWGLSFSDYPVAEIGDMCALTTDDTVTPAGFTHAVQRTWSDAEAKAGHDPYVPVPVGSIYFNSVLVPTDTVTLTPPTLRAIKSQAIKIPVGTSKVVDVQLFSDAPLADWSVSAYDLRNLLGEPKRRDFKWDRTSGKNGDTLHLTITALATGPLGGTTFATYSSAGPRTPFSFTFVEN